MPNPTWDQLRQALKLCSDLTEDENHYINKTTYEKGVEISKYMERLNFPVPKLFTMEGEAIIFEWDEDAEASIFKQRDKSKIMAYLVVTEDEPPKTNKFTLTFR